MSAGKHAWLLMRAGRMLVMKRWMLIGTRLFDNSKFRTRNGGGEACARMRRNELAARSQVSNCNGSRKFNTRPIKRRSLVLRDRNRIGVRVSNLGQVCYAFSTDSNWVKGHVCRRFQEAEAEGRFRAWL